MRPASRRTIPQHLDRLGAPLTGTLNGTDALADVISEQPVDRVVAIGPLPMMAAISAPGAMTEIDLGELRAVGLDDRDILDVALVTAYFNFVNRIAMSLGVESTPDELTGYKDD